MNICILVKPIIDSNSVKWDYQNQKFSYLSYTFNSADLLALQWACDYKRKNGATITVIVAVDSKMEIDEKGLLKYDLDHCIILKQPRLKEQRNESARLLAMEIRKRPFDVILSGSVSEDENLGITPTMVAELLQIPSITNIHQIEVETEKVWKVYRSVERGIVQLYKVKLPALIGVVHSLGRRRYIPRYSNSINVKKHIVIRELKDTIQDTKVKILKVSEPKPNIRYFDIPNGSLSTEQRLLKIMGIAQDKKEQSSLKVATDVNEKTIHFLTQKLQKWLKEG
ncbi:hypothetical protein [Calidifontibacillus erzurumensis]|uniref:Electron transfer flavoprotein alpha/beta-subunit N-terminal domain-containing protein n=1 Tax=Calidifontibacillus erzurumensis TaxID=2741433 RepID=A0A8J8KCA9_9BACI|nr:hypothetical protein [Calidifontibacillus erzurumensis]NSL51848.1 hypothetical protein [Calidifontibacillus erzurumensis]